MTAKKFTTIALHQVLVMRTGLVSPAIVQAEMLRAGAARPGPLPAERAGRSGSGDCGCGDFVNRIDVAYWREKA
jgi:hypothetical protein